MAVGTALRHSDCPLYTLVSAAHMVKFSENIGATQIANGIVVGGLNARKLAKSN